MNKTILLALVEAKDNNHSLGSGRQKRLAYAAVTAADGIEDGLERPELVGVEGQADEVAVEGGKVVELFRIYEKTGGNSFYQIIYSPGGQIPVVSIT